MAGIPSADQLVVRSRGGAVLLILFVLANPAAALSLPCRRVHVLFLFLFPSFFPLFFYPLPVRSLSASRSPSTLDNKARMLGLGRKGKLGIRPRNYLSNFFNVAVSHLALMYAYNFHRRGSGLASNPRHRQPTHPTMLSPQDERVHLPDGKDQKKSRSRVK